MTQRAKLAASILTLAAAFSALIALADAGEAATSKTRLFLALVRPLIDSFGAGGAIGILMGTGLASAVLVWLWPLSEEKGRIKSRPSRTLRKSDPSAGELPPARATRRRSLLSLAGIDDEAVPNPGPMANRDADLQGHRMAREMATAMQAELDRLDRLSEERTNSGPPKPGIGEARYHPIVFCEHIRPMSGTWLSYYGGRPTVPLDFVWPVSANDPGRPIHFLMQWDCRQLSSEDATGLLPRDGVLYCFIDYVDSSPFDGRFIHIPGPIDGWQEMEAPASLGPVTGAAQFPFCTWRMDAGKEHLPSRLPRWNFQPVAIDYPAPDAPQTNSDDPQGQGWFWDERSGVGEELLKAQARTIGSAIRDDHQRTSKFERPFPRFPHDWAAVRILAAKALNGAKDSSLMRRGVLPDLDDDAKRQLVAEWKEQAGEMFRFAARHDLAANVPQQIADDVWSWCESIEPAIRLGFEDAVKDAVNSSLGLGSAALDAIPAEWIDRIATRHALAFDYMRDEHPDHSLPDAFKIWEEKKARGELKQVRHLHAPCPNRMFGPPSYVQGYVEEYILDHLLLLEMSSTSGIDFHLGDGVIQFLIKPNDLRERRFDKVVVVASAY